MKKLLTIVSLILISGCVGQSDPARFYSLKAADSINNTFKTKQITIAIEPVKIPVYLDKPQIITRDVNQVELKISELNRWAEPLNNSIQNILAEDIGKYLPNAVVKANNFREDGFNYNIWVEVNKLEGMWNKEAILDAWWSIYDENGKLIARDKIILQKHLDDSYSNLVLQESSLINELAETIARKISTASK